MRCICSSSSLLLLLAALDCKLVSASPTDAFGAAQKVLSSGPARRPQREPQPPEPPARKLHGRFLHITDVHPDPFYKRNSSAAKSHGCHHQRGRAGYYGAERSDCDSPFMLANSTFEWIRNNLKDKIDFVVWTGDSARHDNDVTHPRTDESIYDLNRMVVGMMYDVFKKDIPDEDDDPNNDLVVPVIPTLGNNDIMPHNIMLPGPTDVTRTYLDIWRNFIPESQRHVFEHGAYFWHEVILGKLAVFSLNTIYFFSSNAAVDGCDLPSEPGFQQFTWLKIQLDLMRSRGMKAMLIGHVPPARTKNKQAWDDTCWSKFVIWLWNYRDVVVGNVFGHMNLDHFMLLDKHLAERLSTKPKARSSSDVSTWEELMHIEAAGPYLSELREVLSKMPEPPEKPKEPTDPAHPGFELENSKGKKKKGGKKKKKKHPVEPPKDHKSYLEMIGGKFAERYIPVLVSPSVLPNYYPSLRIIEYNITGLVDEEGYSLYAPGMPELPRSDFNFNVASSPPSSARPPPDPNVPIPPPTGSAPGPAYSPQTLSFTGITQFYANLTRLNGWVPRDDDEDDDDDDWYRLFNGNEEDERQVPTKPRKPRQPPLPFEFELEYSTSNDTDGYGLKDISVRSLVKLADGMRDLDVKPRYQLDDSDLGGDDYDADNGDKKKRKKKKKKARKHKNHELKQQKKKDKLWHLFVKRAFVSAVPDADIGKVS